MTVTLIAHTILTPDAYDALDMDDDTVHADHLAELAGRECYQSQDRPNEKTAANADYLANIIRQKHTSVLAHASFTFRLTDVSRSLTHELIRHRFLAFSELSQRYVDMEDSYTVVPPAFRGSVEAEDVIADMHDWTQRKYEHLYDVAISSGASRKEARQAARCVLPGGTETKMIVSGNVRSWIDFIQQRWSAHADAEIRECAGEILKVLREYAPNSVQHIPDEPYN